MATFMERCLNYCCLNGKLAMINQDSWMFTVTYEILREKLLNSDIHIDSLLHLGPRALQKQVERKVKTVTFVMSNHLSNCKGCYISVYDSKNHYQKEEKTLLAIKDSSCGWFYTVNQKTSLTLKVILSVFGAQRKYTKSIQGIDHCQPQPTLVLAYKRLTMIDSSAYGLSRVYHDWDQLRKMPRQQPRIHKKMVPMIKEIAKEDGMEIKLVVNWEKRR